MTSDAKKADTDRELLERAARAAGIVGEMADEDYTLWIDRSKGLSWNPLTDDGDALRLAVKLGLDLVIFIGGHPRSAALTSSDNTEYVEFHGTDAYAATRRAIVRAAAALASATPLERAVANREVTR